MPKSKNTIMEYRNYYLPVDFPVLLLTGEHWKISDIPSSRLHFHNCLEIGLCHSYSGTMKFYTEPMEFREGDITCVPRNIPHTTYSAHGTESRWSYLFLEPNVLFKNLLPAGDDSLDLSLFSFKNYRHILSRKQYPKVYYLFLSLIDELQNQRESYQLSAKGLLLSLYIELNRIQRETNGGDTNAASKKAFRENTVLPENALVISPALDYIEDNYHIQFPIEVLADVCNLSLTHFRRVFHSIMRTSPLDYLNSIRVMKACNLLRSTEESVLSVSEMVGFASVSNFNRHFMDIMHDTPRNYRNQMLMRQESKGGKQSIIEFTGWMEPEIDPV